MNRLYSSSISLLFSFHFSYAFCVPPPPSPRPSPFNSAIDKPEKHNGHEDSEDSIGKRKLDDSSHSKKEKFRDIKKYRSQFETTLDLPSHTSSHHLVLANDYAQTLASDSISSQNFQSHSISWNVATVTQSTPQRPIPVQDIPAAAQNNLIEHIPAAAQNMAVNYVFEQFIPEANKKNKSILDEKADEHHQLTENDDDLSFFQESDSFVITPLANRNLLFEYNIDIIMDNLQKINNFRQAFDESDINFKLLKHFLLKTFDKFYEYRKKPTSLDSYFKVLLFLIVEKEAVQNYKIKMFSKYFKDPKVLENERKYFTYLSLIFLKNDLEILKKFINYLKENLNSSISLIEIKESLIKSINNSYIFYVNDIKCREQRDIEFNSVFTHKEQDEESVASLLDSISSFINIENLPKKSK